MRSAPAPDITLLQKYYQGFYIDEPVGNNAFSYPKRKNKRIYVPPIMEGSLDDLAIGDKAAFSEIVNGVELNPRGLKNFIYLKYHNKDVFIFDNHSHAFFFWAYALKTGQISLGSTLVHVDQHRDTREPGRCFKFPKPSEIDLKAVFDYTNFELNVGNFIKPALAANIFVQVEIIDSRAGFAKSFADDVKPGIGFTVLDIDMDIFSKDMAYIEEKYKIERIKNYMDSASLITIATSPFFMDQAQAIKLIKILFN